MMKIILFFLGAFATINAQLNDQLYIKLNPKDSLIKTNKSSKSRDFYFFIKRKSKEKQEYEKNNIFLPEGLCDYYHFSEKNVKILDKVSISKVLNREDLINEKDLNKYRNIFLIKKNDSNIELIEVFFNSCE